MAVIINRLDLVVTAGAYSSNDVVGGRLSFGGIPAHILLVAVKIKDLAKQAGAYTLVLFNDAPTTINDNATYDIADADLDKIVAAVQLDDTAGAHKFDFSDNKIYLRSDLTIPLEANGGLYGYLIAAGTPTYAATTDVSVALHLVRP